MVEAEYKQTTLLNATRGGINLVQISKNPSFQEGKAVGPVGFIDIYPTLCELAGLSFPEHLQGHSLVKTMKGKEETEFAISQFHRGEKMGYAIRDKRYRYVEWIEEGFHANPEADLTRVADKELFDYEKDPWETINVADMEEYREVQEMMEKKLHGFYKDKLKFVNRNITQN